MPEIPSPKPVENPPTSNQPAGITILGIVNILLLGLIPLSGAIIYLNLYYTLSPQDFNAKILTLLKLPKEHLSLASKIIGKALFIQIIISLAFIVSGAGIITRKEWGRRMVLFMSMGIILFGLIIVMLNSSLIIPVISQIAYPAALVLYFSDRKIAENFSLR